MTLVGVQYQFTCDSCGDHIEVQGATDLENIPSVLALADHEFDEKVSHDLFPCARVRDGHICSTCVLRSDIYSGSMCTVADVKATIQRVEQEEAEEANERKAET